MKFAMTGTWFLSFGINALACIAAPAIAADGKAVYDKTCVVCHK